MLEKYARVPPEKMSSKKWKQLLTKEARARKWEKEEQSINRAQIRTTKRDQENNKANQIAREPATRSRACFPCEGRTRSAARS